jgi:hypothetical protein
MSGDAGAKTATAEVDGRQKPNNWFIPYPYDMAVAAVVPSSGEGYKFAGRRAQSSRRYSPDQAAEPLIRQDAGQPDIPAGRESEVPGCG